MSTHFGDASVFMDINDIVPGENFVACLETTLASCNVMLVMIGTHWIEACSDDGKQRLGSEGDFVTLEVHEALRRGIHLIPVLVDDAKMPTVKQLPAELVGLTQHQAITLSDQHFHQDVDLLIQAIEHSYRPVTKKYFKRPFITAGLALFSLAALTLLFVLNTKTLSLRNVPAILSTDDAHVSLVKYSFFDKSANAAGNGAKNQLEALVVNRGSVVIDHLTDLMWQREGSGNGMTYPKAREYVNSLNSHHFAGYGNWRLPSFEEAMSLMTVKKGRTFHLDPTLSTMKAPFIFTSDLTPEGKPWVIFYHNGIALPQPESFNAFVRAVRTIP